MHCMRQDAGQSIMTCNVRLRIGVIGVRGLGPGYYYMLGRLCRLGSVVIDGERI
jgi:hypothetical protein